MRPKIRWQAPLAAMTLALGGCATQPPAPTAEVAAARATVSQAQPSASRYAPEALRAAQAKLQSAEAALARGENERALLLAEQAEADAKLAWAQAEHERSRRALAEVNEGVELLKRELERRPQ
jgi:hypothetical protein